MTYPNIPENSRPAESEVDRAQRKEARRRRNPWSYVVGLLAVAAMIALGFLFQDDFPSPSFRASTSSSSN
jgi:hypothetical protein